MEKSDVTSMRRSKSHEGGIAELLNFKQKNKDMNEFIKVPMSEKLAYCFGDPALTLIYTITTTLLTYFYTNVVGITVRNSGRSPVYHAAVWQHRQDYLCIFDIQSDEHRCIHGNQPAISFAGIADEP